MIDFDDTFFLVWPNGNIEACNLAERISASNERCFSPTHFDFLYKWVCDGEKSIQADLYNSKFRLLDIEQVKAEWIVQIDYFNECERQRKKCRHRYGHWRHSGRRMYRHIRTFNERKQNFLYRDIEEGYAESQLRGKRRHVPDYRDGIHSGTKTMNWKKNRKTQYKPH